MNKKILAAAIAAAVAAPTAALANDVTIYGIAHASVDYLDSDYTGKIWSGGYTGGPNGVYAPLEYDGKYDDNGQLDGFDVASRASRLGFKGTEDLANGLKAIWKMEFQVDIADKSNGGCSLSWDNGSASIGSPTVSQGGTGAPPSAVASMNAWRAATIIQRGSVNPDVLETSKNPTCESGDMWTARNAYVGLAGGWGTFLVGRHDTPYKMTTQKLDLFADTLADNNSTIGFVDIRTNSAIAYVSPNWSGFSFAGAVVAPHVYASNSTDTADSDGLAEAYSLAATYDNGGFFATVGYEVLTSTWIEAWANAPGANLDDNEKWRVGLGWTGAGFTVGGLYEWENDIAGLAPGADAERWQISAGYTFGNNMIKAMYGQGNFDTGGWVEYDSTLLSPSRFANVNRDKLDGDSSAWAIGLDHNFSKRTKVYALYTNVDYNNTYLAQEAQPRQTDSRANWNDVLKGKLDGTSGGFSIGMVHSF